MTRGWGGAVGFPAVLTHGDVILRPYRRGDAHAWSEVRLSNEAWLRPWEAIPPGVVWADVNNVASFHVMRRALRNAARTGESMPFAICLRRGDGTERFAGHINIGNIVRRAFSSAYCGYWIDGRLAGRGIVPAALALVVDHALGPGHLHRVEVNIRPENKASRRVVEKLGFREEGYHPHYMYIDGGWRDHIGYAITVEDLHGGSLVNRLHHPLA